MILETLGGNSIVLMHTSPWFLTARRRDVIGEIDKRKNVNTPLLPYNGFGLVEGL